MTAGIAAARPNAVASSASAMPGATTARLVVCDFEIPMKLFMMRHTVPNSPTNGEVAPMVASKPMPSRIRLASARTSSAKRDAARSLMPASLEIPADSRASRIAAANSEDKTLLLAPSANCASASDLASPILSSAVRSLRCTNDSSMIFAMNTVHVTSEAKASPIMTALTRMSADRNIDQGDNSFSPAAADLAGRALASVAFAAPPDGPMATEGTVVETCAAGSAFVEGVAAGSDGAATDRVVAAGPPCCADTGDTSDSISNAQIAPQLVRRNERFIVQSR